MARDDRWGEQVTIELMNKSIKWLIWALCVLGLGGIIDLAMAALIQAVIGGWVVLSTTIWWGVTVGLACSLLCTMTGIILAVRGLMMLIKQKGGG